MKIDKLIAKRFDELDEKAQAVYETCEPDFVSEKGIVYRTISSSEFQEWSTSVMNLLQRAFGEESVHFQNFSENYRKLPGRKIAAVSRRTLYVIHTTPPRRRIALMP